MRNFWKARIGQITMLVSWGLILYQATVGIFTPSDQETARWFAIGLILISSFAITIGIKTPERKITYAFTALGIQMGGFLVFGSIGLLDVSGTNYAVAEGFIYAMDGMGGFATAISAIDGIVGILAKLLPLIVLIVGEVGIMLSDTPDEMQTPLIETGISIALLAVFYGVGNLVGYI